MGGIEFIGKLGEIGWDIAKTDINNAAAAQRERDARLENFRLNEEAAQNSDMRTRALYNDIYSPLAQIQQLKDAGLSPSVYYNGGAAGMSGQAGAQGAGASGINPTIFGLGELDLAGLAKIGAETRLINAQADELEGKNEMGKAKIADYLANAGYKKEAENLVKAQTAGQEFDYYLRQQGANAELHILYAKASTAGYEAEKAFEDLEQAKLLTQFKKETFITEVETRKEQLNEIIQGIAESKSRIKLNNEQIEALKATALKTLNDIVVDTKQVDGYTAFINKRIDMMPQELDATLKDLSIKERKMYIDAISEVIKGVVYGAMTKGAFQGGNPTMGKGAGGKIPQKGKRGGNATNPNLHNSSNDIWTW